MQSNTHKEKVINMAMLLNEEQQTNQAKPAPRAKYAEMKTLQCLFASGKGFKQTQYPTVTNSPHI